MLRVIVEIVPFGDEERKRTIESVEIANVGGDMETGHYMAIFSDETSIAITGHKRRLGVWPLIAKIAKSRSRHPR